MEQRGEYLGGLLLAPIALDRSGACLLYTSTLQKVVSSPAYSKYLREPIVTIRQDRYVVPVKSEFKNEVPGLIHDVSATGSTFFIEPMSAVNADVYKRQVTAW